MSDNFAASYLKLLKESLGVRSDDELSKLLHVGKSTISSWRQRNNVPISIRLRYIDTVGELFHGSGEQDVIDGLVSSQHLMLRHAIHLFLFSKYYDELVFPDGATPILWWADYRVLHWNLIDPIVIDAMEKNNFNTNLAFEYIVDGIDSGKFLTINEIASPPETGNPLVG